MRGCRLAGTTSGYGVGSGCPSEPGWGQGSAVQMAQMARFGFLTVGSCSGHQVTGAQLALPAAGDDSRQRSFFGGLAGSAKGLKKCCATVDIPYHGLACTSFLYPACLPALVARADLPGPACCSLQDSHQLGRMGAT